MRKTKKILKIGRGTLRRAMLKRERLEDPTKNELWTFNGRLPQKDKEINEALKSLIEDFKKNNTCVFPNQRDVVRRRISSQNCDPHEKKNWTQLRHNFLQNLLVCILKLE